MSRCRTHADATRSTARRALALVALVIASSLASTAHAITVPQDFVVENAVGSGTFDTPTSLAFFPSGRMLVGEKRGRVYSVWNGVKSSTPLWSSENEVLNEHDRGLLSIAIDPNYAVNRYVYFLFTVDPDSNGTDTNDDAFSRLVRYQVSASDSNALVPGSRAVLFGRNWREGIVSASPSHTVGALRWGRDGSLLVSTGDGGQYSNMDAGGQDAGAFGSTRTDPNEDIGAFRSQYIGSLAGKVLRLDPANGQGYPSNPFYDGNAASIQSRVWAYGVRNSFRFTVRPGTGSTVITDGNPGTLYMGDVGWATWEDLNVVNQGGRNLGWPCYEGIGPQSSYQAANPSHHGCGTIGTAANPSPHTPPISAWHHGNASSSVPPGFVGNASTGGVFYTGTTYPTQYRNQYFFADYGQSWIKVAVVNASNQLQSILSFASGADGPVDFSVHPTNNDIYYVAIGTSEVRRIRYTGQTNNNPPIANATGTPTSGNAPLTVNFSSAGTSDPNGDALTLSWDFGDGSGSNAANPSYTYAGSGTYTAVLTADDGRGGVGRDTVIVTVTGTGGGGFPSTVVLDNFNRADGALGANWVDPAYTLNGVSVIGNALQQTCCYQAPVWSPVSFGPDQEAYVTLATLSTGSPGHDLMLKVQGNSWNDAHIEVRYDDIQKHVGIHTYTPGTGWQQRGSYIPTTFVSGNQLGVRARANGIVEVFRNGAKIGEASLGTWPFAGSGGRIGLTLDGTAGCRIDNFGGGNASLGGNTPPQATILTPADGSFYVAGDQINLSGTGNDAEQTSQSLTYRWEMDVHHNTHIHPNSIVIDGPTGSYGALNHDDGTGVFDALRLIVIDNANARDTARVNIYPEVDLEVGPVTTVPAAPTVADPVQYGFTIHNRGRMPAPYSRWRLVVDGAVLSERDTLVAARDSVRLVIATAPGLAVGNHVIRVKADTLAAVVETNETNNGQTRVLTINTVGNTPPVAAASGTPGSGVAPLTVNFSSAGSSDPNGDPLTYVWVFGDGTPNATTANPSHVYTAAGGFTAVLTVNDGQGGSAQASVPITVTAPPAGGFPSTAVLDNFNRADGAPGANWADPVYNLTGVQVLNNQLAHVSGYKAPYWNATTFGPDQEVYITLATLDVGAPGHDLMLKVQGTGWSSAHVEVRYDDQRGRVSVNTYTPGGGWTRRGGFITIRYASGDQFGARAFANGTVEVYKNGVKIGQVALGNWAYAALGGKVGLTLDGTTDARFDNFGGGNVGGAPPANTPPVANAAGNPTSGVAPLTVNFSSAGSSDPDNDPLTYAWVFGDGTPNATTANPTHVYTSAGSYTAVLTVSDGRGGNTPASVPISVSAPGNTPPVAAASGTPTSGVAPLSVNFSSAGSSDPNGDPLTYAWVFGDGTPNATTANPTHVYSNAGNYTAVLTVSDGRGGSAQASVPITATPAGGGGFPTTVVLDNFNRANGALGANWVDPAYTLNGTSIVSNAMQHISSYQAPVWSPTSFGSDQEAYVTIATLASGDPGHDLMLKVQGNSWSNAHIEVRYDDILKHIGIHTYDPAVGGWITRGGFIPVTFVSGDQLGARAKANGIVEVFKNGVKLGEASMGTWAYASQGGRIGLTLDGTVGARFDNFGGGNTAPAAMGPVALQLDLGDTEFAPVVDLPSMLSLGNAYPNPTDGRISLELALPGSARVEFAVYDIQGRSVWRQDERTYPAGRARLAWTGEELGGSRVNPGIYLARVAVDGRAFTRRFVIVR